ncbi:hypothetical protein [Rhizobium rhizogenes]|uniref:hypothetical protein n=1 Tax=Rhizobium rhizogenes TaxID=359 RepID=UPI0022C50206|nr:hypothetical protein [Rhizobium rhizogenes]MCZ7484763.1 hypothetical protein [Rhizobium rhizogenes]
MENKSAKLAAVSKRDNIFSQCRTSRARIYTIPHDSLSYEIFREESDPKAGTDWKSMPPVRCARDAGLFKKAWAATKKGRSEDRPFLISVTGLIGSPCRPSGALATPGFLKGMGGNEKGRSEDRPFLISVSGLIGSPCRLSGALATPDFLKRHGRQRKRAIRRPPFLNSSDRTD